MTHRNVNELIDDCFRLQEELGFLTPIVISLFSTQAIKSMMAGMLPTERGSKWRETWERVNGLDKIKRQYVTQVNCLEEKLSDLANLLRNSGQAIESLQLSLSDEQFAWLLSNRDEIRKHVREPVKHERRPTNHENPGEETW
jgi:hypothetical protein